MKAAVLFKPNEPLQVVECELDPPKALEVRVKMKASGVCQSDWHIMNGDWPSPMPIVPGHEAAGEILECGAGVTTVKPGDHVIFSFRPHCGRCRYCTQGRTVLCIGRASVAAGLALRRHPAHQAQGPGHQPDGPHRHLRRGGRRAGRDGRADPQGHAVAAGGTRRLLRGDRRRRRDAPRQDRGGLHRAGDRLRRRRPQRHPGRACCRARPRSSRPTSSTTSSRWRRPSAPRTPINTAKDNDPVKKVKEITGGLGVDYSFDAVSIDKTQALAFDALGAGRSRRGGRHLGRHRAGAATRPS